MLASIANVIAKANVNIENLEVEEDGDSMSALKLLISVSDPIYLYHRQILLSQSPSALNQQN
jgi:(p)ppGpp synthase/HD superfamily hydrolase